MNIHRFTEVDRTQPWFHELKRAFEARLAWLREQNDNPKKTPEDTATIRGQIIEIKCLLNDMGRNPTEFKIHR